MDVPLGLSFYPRRLQASAGHATVCKVLHCSELWRSVCPSPQWSRGHAVVAEDLNHTVWRTFLYSPAIQIAACGPSGEWPLPCALSYEEQRLDVSWFQAVRQRNGRECIGSGRLRSHPTMCTVRAEGPLGRACDDPYVPPAGGRSGPQVAGSVFWTLLAVPRFSAILFCGRRISGPGSRVNYALMTACHEILIRGRSRKSRASRWVDVRFRGS